MGSSNNVPQKRFGIWLELMASQESGGSAPLDFDEIEEFNNAITFIHEASRRIANEQRDYTEVKYRTKDQIEIGFYQTVEQEQKALVRLGGSGVVCFIPVLSLPR